MGKLSIIKRQEKQILDLKAEIRKQIVENNHLRRKLVRVQDWLKFNANAEGGIVDEISTALKQN